MSTNQMSVSAMAAFLSTRRPAAGSSVSAGGAVDGVAAGPAFA